MTGPLTFQAPFRTARRGMAKVTTETLDRAAEGQNFLPQISLLCGL